MRSSIVSSNNASSFWHWGSKTFCLFPAYLVTQGNIARNNVSKFSQAFRGEKGQATPTQQDLGTEEHPVLFEVGVPSPLERGKKVSLNANEEIKLSINRSLRVSFSFLRCNISLERGKGRSFYSILH